MSCLDALVSSLVKSLEPMKNILQIIFFSQGVNLLFVYRFKAEFVPVSSLYLKSGS